MAPPVGRTAVALLLALASCTGEAASPTDTSSPGLPTSAIVTAPPLEAPCSGSTPTIHVTAVNIAFAPDCLAAVAGTRLALAFVNEDLGIRHNIAVFPGPRGYSTNPPYLFQSRFIVGPSVDREPIASLPAGLLHFHCDLHPDLMQGLFAVAPTARVAADSIDVRWAKRRSAPTGYVFDVQVKTPGDADFIDWLTDQSRTSARFVPATAGTYAFRVSIYPENGELRPIGYSPPAVAVWNG